MTEPTSRLPRSRAALAALFYLAIALAGLHVAWENPKGIVPRSETIPKAEMDQSMVVATITDNARRLLHRPMSFFDSAACHPLPRSYTLGEHMFANGVLAALPLALTGEPVLSYNLLLLMLAWFSGLSMFAFTWFLTRSFPGALVAGLLFELFWPGVRDPTHPFSYADFWTVLTLLFLARLFVRGGWRNAVGAAVFGVFQLGESLYAVLAAVVLLVVVTMSLAVRYRDVLLRRLPQLAAIAAVAVAAAWLIFAPYLDTARSWGILQGRTPWLIWPFELFPGYRQFPGMLLVGLASIGLLDRARGPRTGGDGDLRLALALAGALLLWLSTWYIGIPFVGWRLPSPTPFLRAWVPGLSAVRVPAALVQGVYVALAVLAAYGVVALVERLSRRLRIAVTLVLLLAAVAEAHHPALLRASFGFSASSYPVDLSLPEDDIEMLRSLGGATVLEYPPMKGNLLAHSHFLRTAAEHGGKTSACYNSFGSPIGADVAQLALQLPSPSAAEALGALGFEIVLVHRDKIPANSVAAFEGNVATARTAAGKLEPIAQTPNHAAFRLRPGTSVVEDVSVLGPAPNPSPRLDLIAGDAAVRLRIHNRAALAFRHPQPLTPRPLLARWVDASGAVIDETEFLGRLPIALGPRGSMEMEYSVRTPPPGEYEVLVSLPSRPDRVLARRSIRVLGAPRLPAAPARAAPPARLG